MDTQEPTLRHGDEGLEGWVEYLQGLLILEGHDTVTKNGSFDDATLDAVRKYQLRNGLLADGVVGNQTWASLRHSDPQMAGTDDRAPGTYVEDTREARWVWDEEMVQLDAAADELLFLAVNVGSAPLDASTLANARCRITPPAGEAFDMELVPRNESGSTTGVGNLFFYVASNVNAIPPGRYTAEAWLPDELSGDRSESHFEIPTR